MTRHEPLSFRSGASGATMRRRSDASSARATHRRSASQRPRPRGAALRRDHRILGRRDPVEGSRRRDPHLERGSRAAVRLHRRGGDRQAGDDHHSRSTASRRSRRSSTRSAAASASAHFETVRRRKDGSLVDISLTVSPIRDSQRPDRRRVEDRARHFRAEEDPRAAAAAVAGDEPSGEEPVRLDRAASSASAPARPRRRRSWRIPRASAWRRWRGRMR